ncbi:hypothetical protein SDC9_194896 [bioreactor metagenome]|uniref:Uncharacterized protein n=1 Tax=bioreactor metagenome TaxID=1076179 RepID=A0A645IG70_9ZZZZ
MGFADDSCFSNQGMIDEGAFHFHCPDAVTGDIDNIIDPTENPKVAVFIPFGSVSGEINPRPISIIGVFKTFGIPINVTKHCWPGFTDGEVASASFRDSLTCTIHDFNLHSGERNRAGSRFQASYSG